MKPILAVVFLLFLASDLRSQTRRHSGGPTGLATDGRTSRDPIDPFAVEFTREGATPTLAPPLANNAVPVSQLRIPSKAMKEFERAQKAFQSGDIHTSAEHLQKAVQIYPDFIDAHNALGLRFAQIGEYQKALTEHEIALSLNPRSASTHQDLSFALLLLNRYKEAEAEARQALDLDPRPAAPRYFLARALIGQGHLTSEVIQMLQLSEDAFPNASLVLAQIRFAQGRTDQVIAELRRYLQAPVDPENKQKAECWVAQLSQRPTPTGCSAENTRPSFR